MSVMPMAPARNMARTLRLIIAMCILGVASLAVSSPANAAGSASTISSPDVHDASEVAALWRDIIAASPAMGFTGDVANCIPGATSDEFRAAELRSVNAMRALVGVNAVTEDTAWSAMAQEAALIMAANNDLSHAPDPGWDCYTAEGAEGAQTSNLYLYNNGVGAIWGYVADPGLENTAVGHRRWLLCPTVTKIGLGDTPQSNATKVVDAGAFGGSEDSRDGFVAWPNPGLVPLNYAAPRGLLDRFSVQLPNGYAIENAHVTVTSSSRGNVPLNNEYKDDSGACGPTVIFEPSRLADIDETWTIRVSGLTLDDASVPDITYDTTFVVLSQATKFVNAAFTDFLGRMPTADERNEEVMRIENGAPRSDLVARLSKSNEWVSNLVKGFYLDTLGRAPDASGLTYWTNQIATGRASVAKVASLFYASSEYFATTGHSDLVTWVDDLYRKVLQRSADPGGRAYWADIAANKGRGTVAFSMFQSQESRQARTSKLYVALLGRQPDHAGLLYWAGKLRTQGDLALAVNLAGSSEYAARAQTRF